jgi:hypothetical protein
MFSVDKNIIKIQCSENINDSKATVIVGTGLLLNDLGHFVTAKHVINPCLLSDYCVIYDNRSFFIKIIEEIDLSKTIDIAIFSMIVNDYCINSKFLPIQHIADNSVIGKNVQAKGFLQTQYGLQYSQGHIMSYDNGYYNIQNINLGKGFSGSPIFYNKKIIAFVSNYTKEETQTVCKAFSINKMLDIYKFEDYSMIKHVDEFYINKIINENAEEQILEKIHEYKKRYVFEGDPLKIIQQVKQDINIYDLLDEYNNTIGYADLLQLAGNLLVNSQYDDETILQARKYLVKSNEILSYYPDSDIEIIKKKVKTEWLRSITHKQLTDTKEAHKIVESTIFDLGKHLNFEIGLPLYREIAVLEGQDKVITAFDFLKNNIDIGKHKTDEIFHCFRRLFEFNLFVENLDGCDKLYPFLNLLFDKVKKDIQKIYIYTYQKNLFHYYYLKGEIDRANKLNKQIRQKCTTLNLKGQINGLDRVELLLSYKGS